MISNLKIPTRLTLSILAFVIPLGYLLYAYSGTKQEGIDFAAKEVQGDAYQIPLINIMAATNEAIIAIKSGEKADTAKIDGYMAELEKLDAELKEDLALTDEKQAENVRFASLKAKWAEVSESLSNGKITDSVLSFVDDSKGASDYVLNSSNLVLDPDLDSYYVMDVTAIRVPMTLQRMKDILRDVTPLVEAGEDISLDDRIKISTYANLIAQSDIGFIVPDFDIILKEDPNFYGTSESLQKNIPPLLADYKTTNEALVATLQNIASKPGSVSKADFIASLTAAQKSTHALWFSSITELDVLLNARIEAITDSKIEVLVGAALVIALAFGFFFVVARSIKRPLLKLQNVMIELANGNLEKEVPCVDLKDEIGAMANTVQVFKNNSLEARRLSEEQRKKYEQESAQKARLDVLIKNFEAKASALLERVAKASNSMSDIAEEMVDISSETTTTSKQTLVVTAEASSNVTAVASAVEELSSSINEISSQLASSATHSGEAVSKTRATDGTVQKLALSTDRINEITSLIGGIANQINLLALNATIESARAGEAGKGFAVVASEVKNLANQASEATDTISKQVSEIQSVVQEVVSALNIVRVSIEENNKISTAISAAVEEQGAASREIAANIQQASNRVMQVSEKVGDVSQMAVSANDNSKKVHDTAQEFSLETNALRDEVEKFLVGIRNS